MKPIDVTRSNVILDPDRTHVLARPFRLLSDQRSIKITARVMALPEAQVHTCPMSSTLAAEPRA
jgi:hypothetical protein